MSSPADDIDIAGIAYANYYYDSSVPLAEVSSTEYNPAIICSRIMTAFDASPAYLINPHYIRSEGHDEEYVGIKTALYYQQTEDAADSSAGHFNSADYVLRSHHGLDRPLNLPLIISPAPTDKGSATLAVDVNMYMSEIRSKLDIDVKFRADETEDVKFVYDGDIHNGKAHLVSK